MIDALIWVTDHAVLFTLWLFITFSFRIQWNQDVTVSQLKAGLGVKKGRPSHWRRFMKDLLRGHWDTAERVEEQLNCESPDTYPHYRKPMCEQIAKAVRVLRVVEDWFEMSDGDVFNDGQRLVDDLQRALTESK